MKAIPVHFQIGKSAIPREFSDDCWGLYVFVWLKDNNRDSGGDTRYVNIAQRGTRVAVTSTNI